MLARVIQWIECRYASRLHHGRGLRKCMRCRSLLLGAAYYFEQPWIVEGGIRFNSSNPGSVQTTQQFLALTYGRQKQDVVTARVGWGEEGYLAIGPATQLVNFRSRADSSIKSSGIGCSKYSSSYGSKSRASCSAASGE